MQAIVKYILFYLQGIIKSITFAYINLNNTTMKYKGDLKGFPKEETVSIPLSFVKEAHKAACDDWKDRIEEHVPELKKPKLDFGRWIKDDRSPEWMVFYTSDGYVYGISIDGDWYNKIIAFFNPNSVETNRYATNEEIEEGLKKIAIKKGFVNIGEISFKNTRGYIHNKGSYNTVLNTYTYFDMDNSLLLDGVEIFKDGKWAEIIENPIPQNLQGVIDELGKEKIIELLNK